MRLRNKKTGRVIEWEQPISYKVGKKYYSLAELTAEWEDYDEPKTYYYISDFGAIREGDIGKYPEDEEDRKRIGNYFETKEEAEKAAEKLKAWKRLKDFGCGFMLDDHFTVKFVGPDARKITSAEEQKSLSDAFKLLFGGKE